ncbi:MAG: hypothetical protein KDK39_07900 [Leptospiraceae bacterium]|nr:hypothetical protein [Leptospiraceae bacterium]
MKQVVITLVAVSLLLFTSACNKKTSQKPAKADEVAACVQANADEGQSAAVLEKYCDCMWDKWPEESEAKSITDWEKTAAGKDAEDECDQISGWQTEAEDE